MSVSILLVPAAIAISSVIQKRASSGVDVGTIFQFDTRMKNAALVQQALVDAGASVESVGQGFTARWSDSTGSFQRDADGIWSAHFTGAIDESEALELVGRVDKAYGLRVQQSVLAMVSARAADAGMSLTSQTVNDDASVTMVLSVDRVLA